MQTPGADRVFSGSPYEPQAGFCRALRRGERVLVAGTAPLGPDGRTVHPGQAGPQARRCLEIAVQALERLGASAADAVRTRLYLTDPADFDAVARVHGEFFREAPPVATCVVVASLLDPEWRVEIEVEAQVHDRVTSLDEGDRAWLRERSDELYGAPVVISRGRAHEPAGLEGCVASRGPERLGVATYRVEGSECELVTLDAFEPHRGVGTRLLEAVEERARARGCARVWLITTNDNLEALRFYQRRGYRLKAVHPAAVDEVSRPMKPQIPTVGCFRIPLRDELELDKGLS